MRSDLQRGLVWFLNYSACDPNGVSAEQLDLHNTSMLPQDVELFAHRWLAYSRSMDIDHDGIGRPMHVVESFVNSPQVASLAWPINSHAMRVDVSASQEAVDGLRSGSLNSLSLDAFTFNVKQRLPVARPASAAVRASSMSSTELAGLAQTIVSSGFSGVKALHKISDGLFVATRDSGTPIGVQVFDSGDIEISAADSVWANLGVAIATSASLVHSEMSDSLGGYVPDHGGMSFQVDYRPWDPVEISRMLETAGVQLSPWAFVAADGNGILPHHTMHGVNVQAVTSALSELGNVPEPYRLAVHNHLLQHLRSSR